ncbi:HD domain-containing protein [Falsibacillus pallidus]|uniref:HD domain-containing protein n=1 Tax=Falsibacillus pallidus TaxID=493781 RepID=UPI003D96386A
MKECISNTEEFVKSCLKDDSSGHDWHHIDRVRKMALHIAEGENSGDPFIIEMASLLHDIPDEKLNEDIEKGKRKLSDWIDSCTLHEEQKQHILEIIYSISFNGGHEAALNSVEAMIVRDADRLDAIGAIGIARTFAYGGKKGSPMYDPAINVRKNMTKEEYRQGKSSSIHHFYEKLLLLQEKMMTDTAKNIAYERHHFMEQFLEQFYKEWNGYE